MKKFLAVLTILAVSLIGVSAFAAQIKVDDDTFANFGTKARIQFQMVNPDTNHKRVDMGFGEGRIYFSGQITNLVKFGFNYDFTSSETNSGGAGSPNGGRLTDGFITLDLAKELKIQSGVYRMAVSRIGLQDSYQYILITGPAVGSSTYLTSELASYRNFGVTAWGDLAGGMVRYYVGLWEGDYLPASVTAAPINGTNPNDEIGLTGRLVINFMDPEKGYACPGCYIGKAKVANVGVGYATQDYVDGTGADRTATVMALDAFYDADGLTAEAAYFSYDADLTSGVKPTGWYVQGAYVMGKIQPAIRYESWDADAATGDYTRTSAGVNYLFDGQAAKVGIEYAKRNPDPGSSVDTWTAQLQVQF